MQLCWYFTLEHKSKNFYIEWYWFNSKSNIIIITSLKYYCFASSIKALCNIFLTLWPRQLYLICYKIMFCLLNSLKLYSKSMRLCITRWYYLIRVENEFTQNEYSKSVHIRALKNFLLFSVQLSSFNLFSTSFTVLTYFSSLYLTFFKLLWIFLTMTSLWIKFCTKAPVRHNLFHDLV